jgi:protein-L-isoaspartate(D-aspartate) O-methyltransferase
MFDYQAARLAMVEGQLRTNKVTDEAVLDAFLAMPRERFVPPHLHGIAYVDEDIPLGGGRYLMEPMVLARLLQAAAVGQSDHVLAIGVATGYAAALLARMAASVIAVECEPRLIALARAQLAALGVGNVTLIEAPLEEGHPAADAYDAILIDGAVAAVPDAISRQLAAGGRLVTVLKRGRGMTQAVLMTQYGGVLSYRPLFDAGTPLLPAFQPEPGFVF